jgi:hypothetical protein
MCFLRVDGSADRVWFAPVDSVAGFYKKETPPG